MTAFPNGVNDTSLSSVFENEAIESQFVDAVKVKYDEENTEIFDSIIITASEKYCEQRAPVLEAFIGQIEEELNLDYWESNEEEGWYALKLLFQFTV